MMYAPIPGEDEEEEDKEEEGNTQLTPHVARSVDDGAAWRPSFPEETNYPWWWYDFSNISGEKGLSPTVSALIDIKALTDFMTRVVTPEALMAIRRVSDDLGLGRLSEQRYRD